MPDLNELQRRDLIINYKRSLPTQSNYCIAKYFKELNISERTTYSVLKNYDENGTVERSHGSGRPAVKMQERSVQKLVNDTLSEKTYSQRDLSNKYNISQPYVNKILSGNDVHAFKKQKIPFSSEKQKETQKIRVGRLYREFFAGGNPEVVMDDESYFTLSNDRLPQNSYYYAHARGDAPDHVKFSEQKKFELKIMIWIAISSRGVSSPYIIPSNVGVNKELYSHHCITKRLLPFIEEYHSDGHYIFWPDLASSHYAVHTLATFNSLGINFVSKDMNPPAVPHLRPIEDYWALLKAEVYKRNWKAENLEQLKNRIKYCIHKVNSTVITKMMDHININIRKSKNQGCSSSYH